MIGLLSKVAIDKNILPAHAPQLHSVTKLTPVSGHIDSHQGAYYPTNNINANDLKPIMKVTIDNLRLVFCSLQTTYTFEVQSTEPHY